MQAVLSPGDARHHQLRARLAEWMRQVIREQFNSANAWANKAKVAPSTISRFLKAPQSASMPSTDTITKLAAVAQRQPPPLSHSISEKAVDKAPDSGESDEVAWLPGVEDQRDLKDTVPVKNAGRAGPDQSMFLEDGPLEHIPRPAVLRAATKGYALLVVGDSMVPMYRAGQRIFVNPQREPRPGRGIVVYKASNVVIIKEYVKRTAAGLTVREYQPEQREFLIPAGAYLGIHTIVGTEDD